LLFSWPVGDTNDELAEAGLEAWEEGDPAGHAMHADKLAKLMGVECLAVFDKHGHASVLGLRCTPTRKAQFQGWAAHSDALQVRVT